MKEEDKTLAVLLPSKELAIARVIDAFRANSGSNNDREKELLQALDDLTLNHLTERLEMRRYLSKPKW